MSKATVPLSDMDSAEIRERIWAVGVVGASGTDFPTHIKLQARIDTVLVNAAKCEPMLKVDQQLMAQQAGRLIRGLGYVMTATGVWEGITALKAKYTPVIAALTPRLLEWARPHIPPDVYPVGDEVLTIWLAMGRRVPPTAPSVSVGVVVNDVQTVSSIARATEQGYPVIRRTLTVNGVVSRLLTSIVPLGMPLREILALADGVTVVEPGFTDGGPTAGLLMTSLETPITKTTGGLLVLPDNHPLIQRRRQDE